MELALRLKIAKLRHHEHHTPCEKGRVGKSTVSILLYEAFRQAGNTVSMRDWDAQGTSTKSLELIHVGTPRVEVKTPNIVIFDTPPSLEHNATATAVRSADVVLVVTSPSPADIWKPTMRYGLCRGRTVRPQ
jgi:chromosome partitioning protein